MGKKVSVIVPVYNVEKYIKKCLDSIMNQTHTNIEIILVDDGATDNSGLICDEYAKMDPRIRVIHKNNGGLASARNAGVEVATGDYIAYVDSDDWVENDFIELLLDACLNNGADMSVCRYADCYDETPLSHQEDIFSVTWTGKEAVEARIMQENKYRISTSAWNKFYKKEIIEGMLFPYGKYYEDVVYTTEAMLRAKKVAYINKALYCYRKDREGSIMTQGFNPRVITDELPLMSRRNELIREAGLVELADRIDRNYCIRCIEIYRQLYNDNVIRNKDILFNECKQHFKVVYRRCGHNYFNLLDKMKTILFCLPRFICCELLNLIVRE